MKKIIFFVLALMALIGVGVGGWIMFSQRQQQAAEGHAEAEKKKPEGPPSFVQIGPLILPVFGEKRAEQTIMLMIALEVSSDETRERVRQITPRLLNAYHEALYGELKPGMVLDGQIVDVAAVRDRLNKATIKVLGPGVVDDVLIQAVTQRPVF